MATTLVRFEVVLPNVDTGSEADTAIVTFRHNMETLCKLIMYTGYIYDSQDALTQQNVLYGLISTPQQATALNFLMTLNAALGKNVQCTVQPATSVP